MKSLDVVPAWYWPDGVPRYQTLPRTSVHKAAVERWARRTPTNIALAQGEAQIDYRTLEQRVKRASARMRQTVDCGGKDGRNMRIAIAAADGIDAAVAILAALHAGADTLVVDPATPRDELLPLLTAFGCELLVTQDASARQESWSAVSLQELARGAPDEENAGPVSRDRSPAGRLGLRWGDAVALQPNTTVLGWCLAFRAFAMLHPGERFVVARPLATWEGLMGLLAPLAVGAAASVGSSSLDDAIAAANNHQVAGLWLDWPQAEALASDLRFNSPHPLHWAYVSVGAPFSTRKRRRLARLLGAQVLTICGTPATGPIAGSPRTWFIDEAVGTPITGVDLYPVDSVAHRLAAPPWPLLTSASMGVKSTLFTPEMSLEGAAPGRFVENDVLDTGIPGVIDANGFVYLV